MIQFKLLTDFRIADLQRIMYSYTSTQKYEVSRTESDDGSKIMFELSLVALNEPYVKYWDHTDPETEERYFACVQEGMSFGAYDGDVMIGITIAEAHIWNGTLNIWEFGVAASHQRRGIGQGLMQQLEQVARLNHLRVMTAETQNTNVSAIRFYRSVGFEMDAVDLSFYTNHDADEGEVALFMKYRINS